MLPLASSIGIDRLGSWVQREAFGERGKYELSDAMTAAERLADWVETSVLFGNAVSKVTIQDNINDSGVALDKPEEVELIADEILAAIRGRRLLFVSSGYPFQVNGDMVRLVRGTWRDTPVYAFLLLVSMGHFLEWMRTHQTSHHEVGHLFEDVVRASCEGLFGRPAKTVPLSGVDGGGPLSRRMETLLKDFHRAPYPELSAVPRKVKDGGLDVVARAVLQERDTRGASPHVLVQCAAGDNWESKISHPVADVWRNWVAWRGPIWRAFAVPTLMDDKQLATASLKGSGTFVLDRARIIEGLCRAPSDAELDCRVSAWVECRVKILRQKGLPSAA